MNRTILAIAGLALATAVSAQEQEDQPFNPNRDVTRETRSQPSTAAEVPQGEPVDSVSDQSADELEGMKVLTLTGEEIGEIGAVGTSPAYDGRIATVEVGGFIGVGEKTIAVPLSQLQPSVNDEGSVRTSLSRSAIESQPPFDDSGFAPDE